ncbi:hypothetical protein [Pseudomonas helleri]|uniref:Uncharacterized protein n=1 Tax=Pseudomonas helleri TaxID=1608996 RepID=A0A6I1WVK6_9PSED|nr:hypothetical protein [Pseudomonas helleri]MQU45599.1 hypothetical protein [Pseudomonas helleri]
MTISKKTTPVKRVCPCLTEVNHEILEDFIASFNRNSANAFSIAKAFKDYILNDCATYIIAKNNSESVLRNYNQYLANLTTNYSTYLKDNPHHITPDADKIIRQVRQSRVDLLKLLFSTKTFRAEPSVSAKCLSEATPIYDESSKTKKLNLTYSEKDFSLIKSKFKSFKKENKKLTFDDLFFQFMSELKIYQSAFASSFFSLNADRYSTFKTYADYAHNKFSNGSIEDFNKYFLEVFPELHNDILKSLSGLRKMISMEV